MTRLKVTARYGNTAVDGENFMVRGEGDDGLFNQIFFPNPAVEIQNHAPQLHQKLIALRFGYKDRSALSCAEVAALGNLLKLLAASGVLAAPGFDWAQITLSEAYDLDKQLYVQPCPNCSEWLEQAGHRLWRIKPSVLDECGLPRGGGGQAPAQQNATYEQLFPALVPKTQENNTNVRTAKK